MAFRRLPFVADFVGRALLTVAFFFICSWDSLGQQPPAASKSDPSSTAESCDSEDHQQLAPGAVVSGGGTTQLKDKVKADGANSQKQTQGTSNDRLFFLLPNFLTLEDAGHVPALTTKEKFEVVTRSSFDWVNYFWYGALAGIGQAENTQGAYGQGAAGYAKRYGAAFGDGTIEGYMTSAVFPSLLHQDPRYFQLGKGSFWHRTGYALSRIVVTPDDSGRSQFNYSEIVGAGAAASISTFSYYPRNDRTASNVMSVFGEQVGIDAFSIVLKEFWPDIRRKFHRIRSDKAPSVSGQASSIK